VYPDTSSPTFWRDQHADFLLGLHFHPEDEASTFLGNTGWLSPEYREAACSCNRRIQNSNSVSQKKGKRTKVEKEAEG
jgi:hypothetical protein